MLPPLSIPSSFRFNPALGTTGRYIAPNGRMVSENVVRGEMERVISGTQGEMINLSRQLQASEISLQEWYNGMRERMKVIHTANAAIAKGGWAQMTQSDWGAVGQISRQQYQFLNNFAQQIQSGEQPLNGRFLARAGMYAEAGRGTGEDMKRREAGNKGLTEEARILGRADHCPDCLKLDIGNTGWQPIGTLPRISDSVCLTKCKCHFIFR